MLSLLAAAAAAHAQTSMAPADWQLMPPADLRAAAPLRDGFTIDFSAGTPDCPDGAWSGNAVYVMPDRGRLRYKGTGVGCATQGYGWIQYADGSHYFGGVGTLVRGAGRARADEMRPLVAQGNGGRWGAGSMKLGAFVRGELVQDRMQPGFAMAYAKAFKATVTQPTPAMTPDLEAFLNFADPASATVAASPAPGAPAPAEPGAMGVRRAGEAPGSPPGPAEAGSRGAMSRGPAAAEGTRMPAGAAPSPADPSAYEARAARDAAAARHPGLLPPPLLAARPELADLAAALQRYGGKNMNGAPELDKGFFGDVDCEAEAGEDAFWRGPEYGETYRGQHIKCLPTGLGRIRAANGLEWTGGITRQEETPVPSGLGELRLKNGRRLFIKVEDGVGALVLGWATPDGRFGVADQPSIRPGNRNMRLQRDPGSNLQMLAGRTQASDYFRIHNLDGSIVLAYMEPQTGRYAEHYGWSGEPAARENVLRIPELGLVVEGLISPIDRPNDREAAARAQANGVVAGAAGHWKGWLRVTLDQPLLRHPPGRYRMPAWDELTVPDWRAVISPRLRPVDAATVGALASSPVDCQWRIPPDELPPRWVAWTPGCFSNRVAWAYDPQAKLRLSFAFDAEGKVVGRTLVKDYGVALSRGDEYMWLSWQADRFEEDARTGIVSPVGPVAWSAQWGVELRLAPGTVGRAGPDDAGFTAAYFEGPLRGLLPNGPGLCSQTGRKGGEMEPCEYRSGRRVDPVYLAQAKLGRLAREQRDAERAIEQQQQKEAKARQQKEQEADEALQEAAARQKKAQQAADDEASHQAIMQALGDVKRSFDAGAAQMAATNRQSQSYLNLANQIAQQKASQQQLAQQQEAERAHRSGANQQQFAEARQQAQAELAQAREQAKRASPAPTPRPQAQPPGPGSPSTNASVAAAAPSQAERLHEAPPAAAPPPPRKTYPAVPEAVAVCVSAGSASQYRCYSPLSTSPVAVSPRQTSGWQTPRQWLDYVGSCSGARSMPLTDGGVVFYCGYGVSGVVKDAARAAGVTPLNRGTFYCAPDESYCKRPTATGAS